jgi:hypothetical protein
MSTPRFKRVAETARTPEYIEEQFFGAAPQPIQEDPYAELRRSTSARQAHIAKEMMDIRGVSDALDVEQEWAQIRQAERLGTPKFSAEDPFASMAGAVRRASYDVDEGDSMNPSPMDFLDGTSEYAMLSRGASLWDPQLEDVTWAIAEADLERKASVSKRSVEAERQARHKDWEDTKGESLRAQRKTVSARAHHPLLQRSGNSVMRTGFETVVDGRFGLADYDAMAAVEEQRIANATAERERRLAIKANGKTAAEIQEEWLTSGSRPSRMLEKGGNWLDHMFTE